MRDWPKKSREIQRDLLTVIYSYLRVNGIFSALMHCLGVIRRIFSIAIRNLPRYLHMFHPTIFAVVSGMLLPCLVVVDYVDGTCNCVVCVHWHKKDAKWNASWSCRDLIILLINQSWSMHQLYGRIVLAVIHRGIVTLLPSRSYRRNF